ncbi:MAG: hypothetical protein ABIH99_04170 [Candidatus Micrarchaeota archaeon]
MPLDELLISTGVDGLIKLVHSRGRIKISDAAKELGISVSALEEWARVLEDEGILRIEYQFTNVYLVWAGTSVDEVGKKAEDIREEKIALRRDIESLLEKVKFKGTELEKVQKDMAKISTLLDPKLGELKGRLEKLRSLEKTREETVSKHLEKMQQIETNVGKLKRDIETSLDAAEKIKKLAEEEKKGRNVVKEELAKLKDEIGSVSSEVADVGEKAKTIYDKVKGSSSDLSEIESKYKKLDVKKNEVEKFVKLISETEEKLEEMRTRSSSIKDLLKATRKDMEEVERMQREVLAVKEKFGKMTAEMKIIESNVEKYRSGMRFIEEHEKSVSKSAEEVRKIISNVVLDEKKIENARTKMEMLKEEASEVLARVEEVERIKKEIIYSKEVVDSLAVDAEGISEKLREYSSKVDGLYNRYKGLEALKEEMEILGEIGDEKKFRELKGKIESLRRDAGLTNEELASLDRVKAEAENIANMYDELSSESKDIRKQMSDDEARLEKVKRDIEAQIKVAEQARAKGAPQESYITALKDAREQYEKLETELKKKDDALLDKFNETNESMSKDIKEASRLTETLEIVTNKNRTEEIRDFIKQMIEEQKGISSRLENLIDEVKSLNIQVDLSSLEGMQDKTRKIKDKLEVGYKEEREFEKKREHLRKMVEKMWSSESE